MSAGLGSDPAAPNQEQRGPIGGLLMDTRKSSNVVVPHEDRERWFAKLRAEWFRVMRPLGSWVPWELRDLVQLEETKGEVSFWGEGLLQPAPQLREENLRNCIVVPERTVLLERLPK